MARAVPTSRAILAFRHRSARSSFSNLATALSNRNMIEKSLLSLFMNLADLKAFVAVAETGSVNRAALRLNLTQPAITRRVQNFEAALGGKALLDRSSKPPTLTPAGRQVLEYCRRVLAAVGELERTTLETGEPAGELRIPRIFSRRNVTCGGF
jgi:DNA-binding MarR family transcriptional regulator